MRQGCVPLPGFVSYPGGRSLRRFWKPPSMAMARSALPRSLGDGLRGSSKAKSRNTVSLISASIVPAGSSGESRPKRVSAANRQTGQRQPL